MIFKYTEKYNLILIELFDFINNFAVVIKTYCLILNQYNIYMEIIRVEICKTFFEKKK